MSSIRQPVKIAYPGYVDSKDIQENGLLLTDKEIKQTIEVLRQQPEKRFTKNELKGLGLINVNYSILKDGDNYFVVYKRRRYLGFGNFGKIKVAQFIGSSAESKEQKLEQGKLFALKICEINSDSALNCFIQEQNILTTLGRAYSKIIFRDKNGVTKSQFLQELMPGMELFDYLYPPIANDPTKTNTRLLSLQTIIRICHNALKAMNELHSKKIVHCDIKLENTILYILTKQISFVDMGLSLMMNEHGYATAGIRGTRGYVPPEIKKSNGKNNVYSAKTDIYSLGCFYQQLLDNVKLKDEKYKVLWTKLIKAMKDNDPKKRPTAKEISAQIKEIYTSIEKAKGKEKLIAQESKEPKKIDLNSANNWLITTMRDFLVQYQKIETGRQKHLKDLLVLHKDCEQLLSQEKKLSSEDRFIGMVSILENEFSRLKEKWCKPSFFGKENTAENFIKHLNTNTKYHHYTRMIAMILKYVYESPFSQSLSYRNSKHVFHDMKKLIKHIGLHSDYELYDPILTDVQLFRMK